MGPLGRLIVLAVMHICLIPTVFGVLYTPIYEVFGVVFLDEFIEKYFVPGVNAAILHMTPPEIRVSALGYAWIVFTLIGGNSTLLSPVIADALSGSLLRALQLMFLV
eukprot:TRINITY_DN11742_c0_g1_i1.p1 TRINITY_DN11742_c0_g1~~TRINITY_DN11742_c0_g1_i1.p1  ORF type:complete len:107 (-),score=11.37 TRINITY_DN11742_c0_g1_i1:249-569(-)